MPSFTPGILKTVSACNQIQNPAVQYLTISYFCVCFALKELLKNEMLNLKGLASKKEDHGA